MDFLFPSDGSVLVVDDKPGEALPLVELLSSKGIASTYYSGEDGKLPLSPTQKVRLAFFDIQLFGPSDTRSYAANILRLIGRLIPDRNGPYILVLWTTFASQEAEEVIQQISAGILESTRPLAILKLDKSSYFERQIDRSQRDSLNQEIQNSLSTRLPPEDIAEIQRVINNELHDEINLQPKVNAIEDISNDLGNMLQSVADSFQLFTAWESAINRASGATVENFSSLYRTDEYWSNNIKDIILRMSLAQLGKNAVNVGDDVVLGNALKTMNDVFLDLVEHHYPENCVGLSTRIGFRKDEIQFARSVDGKNLSFKLSSENYKKYQVYIDGTLLPGTGGGGVSLSQIPGKGRSAQEKTQLQEMRAIYENVNPLINTRLHVDITTSAYVQPGNVYLKSVRYLAKCKELIKHYYDKSIKGPKSSILDNDGEFKLTDKEARQFKFIELEVSPICDFAQDKWIKYRLLPGIMIPEKYKNGLIDKGENLYLDIPVVKIEGVGYKILFDFRLLKSVNKTEHGTQQPYFRLRGELSASILSRLSSHASRIGISSLE